MKLNKDDGTRHNRSEKLIDHLGQMLGSSEQARFAVGYLFFSRLTSVARHRVWQDGFYVGTFSEYDLEVIRCIARRS